MEICYNKDKVFVLNELERKIKSVAQLQMKLESYLCEPQTQHCFEKKENLKRSIRSAAFKTDSLLAILKLNNISIKDNLDNVERQFEEFQELEEEVKQFFWNRE